MSLPPSRLVLFAACALAAAAPPAAAQSRDRWREEDERRARRERLEREREDREDRAREAARRTAETRARLARERAERERDARERAARAAAERRRRGNDWGDSYRPRITLGGGVDVRDFGGDGDRYVIQGGVDFRSRSGFGVRPELLFAWSESGPTSDLVPCATCGGAPLINDAQSSAVGRSRMVGVAVNGTYTLARSSPVRPYLVSGLGVFSSRTPQSRISLVPGSTVPTYQTDVDFRNDVDVGLTAGAGLEFDAGPVRLFTEFRYLLTDQQRLRGFSGMLPLTAGLRL